MSKDQDQKSLKMELSQKGWGDCGVWLAKTANKGEGEIEIAYLRFWRNAQTGEIIYEFFPEEEVITKEPVGILKKLEMESPPMEVAEVLRKISDLLGWGNFLI